MNQCQQYAMETDRTHRQIYTSNKARNMHQWFSTFCISQPSAAETPASLRLDYMPDSTLEEIFPVAATRTCAHTSFEARLTAYIRR
jgi:hypothetical protein